MAFGNNIRFPSVSGSFYPEKKEELNFLLKSFIENTKEKLSNVDIKALILPHAGYIYSGQTAAWGYRQLPKKVKTPHFVLIGPSHHYSFNGIVGSSSFFWATILGKIKQVLPEKNNSQLIFDDQPHFSEHCLEVQLPFLQYLYKENFSISCFLTGSKVDLWETAIFFLKNYSSSIFIISSDLSHDLPDKAAREKDGKTIKAILRLDGDYFSAEENIACGMMGILILMIMAKKEGWKCKLIHYDTSSTTSGDKSAVVGYVATAFYK